MIKMTEVQKAKDYIIKLKAELAEFKKQVKLKNKVIFKGKPPDVVINNQKKTIDIKQELINNWKEELKYLQNKEKREKELVKALRLTFKGVKKKVK